MTSLSLFLSEPSLRPPFFKTISLHQQKKLELAPSCERIYINLSVHKLGVAPVHLRSIKSFYPNIMRRSIHAPLPTSSSFFARHSVRFRAADRDRDFIIMHSRLTRARPDLLRKRERPRTNESNPRAIYNSRSTNSMSIVDREHPSTV